MHKHFWDFAEVDLDAGTVIVTIIHFVSWTDLVVPIIRYMEY